MSYIENSTIGLGKEVVESERDTPTPGDSLLDASVHPVPHTRHEESNSLAAMQRLECHVKKYNWGKRGTESEVARLFAAGHRNFEVDEDETYAELWMGTHPDGPAVLSNSATRLSSFIAKSHSAGYLSNNNWKEDIHLPFIMKVMSIARSLSLQVHPNKVLNYRMTPPEDYLVPATPLADYPGVDEYSPDCKDFQLHRIRLPYQSNREVQSRVSSLKAALLDAGIAERRRQKSFCIRGIINHRQRLRSELSSEIWRRMSSENQRICTRLREEQRRHFESKLNLLRSRSRPPQPQFFIQNAVPPARHVVIGSNEVDSDMAAVLNLGPSFAITPK
ncbi:phosphomannose isomerase type I, partial [Teladorsagia circumcincta]